MQPQVITIDTIIELRARGLYLEADSALIAYRNDVKKSGKQAVSDIFRRDYRIKKYFKICGTWECKNLAYEGRTKCKSCMISHRKSDKKFRKKKNRKKLAQKNK